MISQQLVERWLQHHVDSIVPLLTYEDMDTTKGPYNPQELLDICVPMNHKWPQYMTYFALCASFERYIKMFESPAFYQVKPSVPEMVNAFRSLGLQTQVVVKTVRRHTITENGPVAGARKPCRFSVCPSREEFALALRTPVGKPKDKAFVKAYGRVFADDARTVQSFETILPEFMRRLVDEEELLTEFKKRVECVTMGGWPLYVVAKDAVAFVNEKMDTYVTATEWGTFIHQTGLVSMNDKKKRRTRREDGSFHNYYIRAFPVRAALARWLDNHEK